MHGGLIGRYKAVELPLCKNLKGVRPESRNELIESRNELIEIEPIQQIIFSHQVIHRLGQINLNFGTVVRTDG